MSHMLQVILDGLEGAVFPLIVKPDETDASCCTIVSSFVAMSGKINTVVLTSHDKVPLLC